MRKNLKFVSAAAAALLTVAPVVATGLTQVSSVVSADANTTVNFGDNTNVSDNNGDVNVAASVSAVAAANNVNGSATGTITATYAGQSYSANFSTSGQNATIHADGSTQPTAATALQPNVKYTATVTGVSFNFGSANANKNVTIGSATSGTDAPTFTLDDDSYNGSAANAQQSGTRVTAKTDSNGVVTFKQVVTSPFYALDYTDAKGVNFYDTTTGSPVTSGSVTTTAGLDSKLNTCTVLAAFNAKYQAEKFGGNADLTTDIADIKAQLEKQGITVDANGYFTAPKSFTVNFSAKSNSNGASATLPVTVTVPNGKDTTETGVDKTVMHIAAVYDKNGKATNAAELRAYNTVSVVSDPVTINGAKFYKIANQDQYIKVGNIDGTSRSLKKNAYVYKSNGKTVYTYKSGKKTKKTVKEAGSSLTTYGSSFNINGKAFYRVGKNQYIKVANF